MASAPPQDDGQWWAQDKPAATGDAYLATLPAARASTAKAIAEGRMSLPSGTSLRSPVGQQMLADVAQYDPTFDVANAPSRTATRKAFTSGKQGQNVTSFNTAIGHLGTLAQSAEGLDNTNYPIWNGIGNFVDTQTGDPRVTNFNVAKQAVVDELERAFKGSGGNVHEIKQWEETLNSSRSPAQLRGAIQQAAGLLQSRIGAMHDSYNAGMGTTDQPLPMLNQHAAEAMARFGSKDYLNKGYGALALPADGAGGPGAPTAGGGSAPNPFAPDPGQTPPSGPAPTGASPATPWDQPDGQRVALATGTTRDVFNAQKSTAVDGFVRSGAPFEQAQAYAKEHGFALDPATYAATLAYAAKNPHHKGSYGSISDSVPMATMQQIESSPLVAPVVAGGLTAANAGSFGMANKIAAGADALGSRLGGDNRPLGDIYSQNLDENKLKTNLAESAHPIAALGGNVVGFMSGDALLGKGLQAAGRAIPGVAALGGKIGAGYRAAAQDAAYGAAYGAGASDSLGDVPANALTGAALGAGGGMLGRGVAKGAAAALTGVTDAGVRRLTQAGVALTPGQIAGSTGTKVGNAVKGAEDWLSGLPGIGGAIKGARTEGVHDFNKAALDEVLAPIGHEASGIGHAGVADAQGKVGQAFNDALSRMQAVPDQALTTDLRKVNQQVQSLSEGHRSQFTAAMDEHVAPYLSGKTQLDGKDLQAVKQGLDGEISNLRGRGSSPQDRKLADRLGDVRDSFMDLAARTTPDAASDFQKANRAYSLLARVEDAASKAKDGVYTPNQFKTAVGRKGYGTTRSNLANGSAPFQQLSNDASTILPSSLPDSGTAGRNVVAGIIGQHGVGAALGGAGGYAEGGSGGALAGTLAGAALGSAAFSRPAVRAVQGVLAGSRGKAITTLGDIIRANAKLGGAVGTPLLLQKLAK